MKSLTAYATLFGLILAAASVAAAESQPAGKGQSSTSTSFVCKSSPTGTCDFVLYTNDCKDSTARSGKPALVCTHELIEQFTLKVGETRVLKNLPPYRQCNAAPGEKVAFPACAR